MSLAVKVSLRDAESVKRFLREKNLLSPGFLARREGDFFLLPLLKRVNLPFAHEFTEAFFEPREKRDFKQLLLERKVISPEESHRLVTSYDAVGDLVVLEVPVEFRRREKKIAQALLDTLSPQVKAVAKRAGITSGKFRIRKIKTLAGKNTSKAVYRENGCAFEIDLNKAYFSGRLSNERLRVSKLVLPKERVLVLFAGVGPFAIEIGKAQYSAQVVGVELNPDAVRSFRQNIKLNKVKNVKAVLADAKDFLKKNKLAFDRVLMPLPKTSRRFLPAAIRAVKSGGVVHYYCLSSNKPDFLDVPKIEALAACKKTGRRFEFIGGRAVKPYAPYVDQVVLDFRVRD